MQSHLHCTSLCSQIPSQMQIQRDCTRAITTSLITKFQVWFHLRNCCEIEAKAISLSTPLQICPIMTTRAPALCLPQNMLHIFVHKTNKYCVSKVPQGDRSAPSLCCNPRIEAAKRIANCRPRAWQDKSSNMCVCVYKFLI